METSTKKRYPTMKPSPFPDCGHQNPIHMCMGGMINMCNDCYYQHTCANKPCQDWMGTLYLTSGRKEGKPWGPPLAKPWFRPGLPDM